MNDASSKRKDYQYRGLQLKKKLKRMDHRSKQPSHESTTNQMTDKSKDSEKGRPMLTKRYTRQS